MHHWFPQMNADLQPEPAHDLVAEVASECVMMRSRLISRVITGIYDQELRPFGINSPQFALLVVMLKMGPSSRAEIGRFHHQDRSTLTRNLKIMLAEGWIEEVSGISGGRARPMAVTQAGRDLLAVLAPSWREAQKKARALLCDDGIASITKLANGILKLAPAA
jgi:DNA-binding MarR family transcriptional regulator